MFFPFECVIFASEFQPLLVMYTVSIIIPVYNVSAYIQRCLESVVAQATDAARIECLLVDDCSTDDSIAVAEAYFSTYDGSVSFRILHHEVNQGQSVARNTGVAAAQGDYLLFLDADDHLVPGSLMLMLEALRTHPEADVVDGAFYHCEDRKSYPPCKEMRFLTNRNEILKNFYKGRLSLCAWNKLIRRDFFIYHVLYFVKGIVFEDIQWSNRLFHCIDSILVLPDVTYIYEYNPCSTMNTTHINATKSIRSFVRVFADLINTSERDVYVDHKIFIFHYILNAMDILHKGNVNPQVRDDLMLIKRRLYGQVVKDGRLILSLYFLLMFQPFYSLLRWSMFRHHVHELERGVAFLANRFQCFHKF